MISELWSNIADFEKRERKHEDDSLQCQARQNARMESYVNLQDKLLEAQSQNPCFHCETLVEAGIQESILPAEFEIINSINGDKMWVCGKHYLEYKEEIEE